MLESGPKGGSKGVENSGQTKEGQVLGAWMGSAHLTDLLGEQQQLGQPNAVPGQVVSKAAQGHVLHDELY